MLRKARTCWVLLLFSVLLQLAALHLPRPVDAATVSVVPAGGGGYALQGIGLENTSAMEITVRYDASLLAGPHVTLGPLVTGAMTAVNTTIPGTVRIVLISLAPIRGSGVIASLIFAQGAPSGGSIVSLDARLADLRGAPLPVTVQIVQPPPLQADTAKPPDTQPAAEDTASTAAGIAPPSILASVVQPGGGTTLHRSEHTDRPDQEGLPEVPPDAAPQEDAPPLLARREPLSGEEAGRKVPLYRPQGVLDRILEHTGEWTTEALLGLFRGESMIGWHQDPPVLLSDGKTTATVTFLSPPGHDAASVIAVMGARLVSLERDLENSNTWIATLLPEQYVWQASLAVGLGERMILYPLTVAPPLSAGQGRSTLKSEEDLRAYLAGRPTDLNSDGRKDRIDDFIAAANYLAAIAPSPAGKPGRTALPIGP